MKTAFGISEATVAMDLYDMFPSCTHFLNECKACAGRSIENRKLPAEILQKAFMPDVQATIGGISYPRRDANSCLDENVVRIPATKKQRQDPYVNDDQVSPILLANIKEGNRRRRMNQAWRWSD